MTDIFQVRCHVGKLIERDTSTHAQCASLSVSMFQTNVMLLCIGHVCVVEEFTVENGVLVL